MAAARRAVKPTQWSHEGLEQRGYKKCPYCWRHLVKLEEHITAHEAGLIGSDGRRRDRTPAERRWANRYDASVAERHRSERRRFVARSEYEELLKLPAVDFKSFRREIDAALDEER